MGNVARLLNESFREAPAKGMSIQIVESEVLSASREQMRKCLVIFKYFHLPLGNCMISDLLAILDLFQEDYSTFRGYLKVVRDDVKEAEERAAFIHDMYVQLAIDLEKLGKDARKNLEAAELAVNVYLGDADKKVKLAKKLNVSAGSLAVAGVTGTLHSSPTYHISVAIYF